MEKYKGIIPAFYACYDKNGNINTNAVEKLTEHFIQKGIYGLYVGGSSGECIYQSVEERKLVLEHVMKIAKGRITIIAHVACNNTKDSCILAQHAEKQGVDAIASIPPIYFHLPDYAIAKYWNEISNAAPNTDFIIYNIPQLAGVALTENCLKTMLENPKVIGVKNSSVPVTDIDTFKNLGGNNFIVFNGSDEQLAAGLVMGADGGIGGTYGVMPELYLKIKECVDNCDIKKATKLQADANVIIKMLCSCKGNMYAVIKEIIKIREGIDLGSVRSPLFPVIAEDKEKIDKCITKINETLKQL